jgi:tetratricopeptide (TPR) repeat protein
MRNSLKYRRNVTLLATSALLLFVPFFCRAQSSASGSTASAAAQQPIAADAKSLPPKDRARQIYLQSLASYLDNHDRAAAEQGFLKAVEIDPKCAPAWFNLGVFAEASKDWPRARTYFNQYLQVVPNGPDAVRAKDQLLILAKYEGGTTQRAAEKEAEYDAIVQRARGFEAVKLFREAIAEAGRAQALDDSRWESYAVVCLVMARQNKAEAAAKFREMALARTPQELKNKVSEALSAPAK